MSHQWIPSNGTEGHQFINDWCSKCARDAVSNGQKTFDDCDDSELCQILDASFRGDAKEWIEHDDGRTECTAFVPLGAAQPQRDDRMYWDSLHASLAGEDPKPTAGSTQE